MADIILNDDQAEALTQAGGYAQVRDQCGRCLGYVAPPPVVSAEEIKEFKRRAASDEPRFTTVQVLEHLRSLGAQ